MDTFSKIRTVADFESLECEEQLEFIEKFPDKYLEIFDVAAEPESDLFYPEKIMTLDDFERLDVSDQIIFKNDNPEAYEALFID